jgi:hypothetical protein
MFAIVWHLYFVWFFSLVVWRFEWNLMFIKNENYWCSSRMKTIDVLKTIDMEYFDIVGFLILKGLLLLHTLLNVDKFISALLQDWWFWIFGWLWNFYDTENSCNDTHNMLALSFDISKNHDIEFYDIHGLQNLFCGEVILKGLVFLYHKILKKNLS